MGLMRYTKNGFLDKYEKENQYVFLGNYVLPKEQIDYIKSGLMTDGKKGEVLDDLELEVIAARIVEKLGESKGKIRGRLFSNGGAAAADVIDELESAKSKTAKVVYTILNIGDVIILEAIGQKNNAMFVCKDTDNLEEILENFGRKGVLSRGFYKVCHDPSVKGEDKYNVNPVLTVMDMASKDPKLLLAVLKQAKRNGTQYSYMKTIEAKYASLAQVDANMSKEEIFDSVKNLMEKEPKTRKKEGVEHE